MQANMPTWALRLAPPESRKRSRMRSEDMATSRPARKATAVTHGIGRVPVRSQKAEIHRLGLQPRACCVVLGVGGLYAWRAMVKSAPKTSQGLCGDQPSLDTSQRECAWVELQGKRQHRDFAQLHARWNGEGAAREGLYSSCSWPRATAAFRFRTISRPRPLFLLVDTLLVIG